MPDPLSPPSASPLSLSRMRRYLGAVVFIRSGVCSNQPKVRQMKGRAAAWDTCKLSSQPLLAPAPALALLLLHTRHSRVPFTHRASRITHHSRSSRVSFPP